MIKFMTGLALTATLAAGTASAQGPAAETGETYSAAVRRADLNLGSPSGLAALHGRIRSVAEQVCGAPKVSPLADATRIAQCRTAFVRSAEGRVALGLERLDAKVVGTR